ncbi:MAG TPA: matrixin family metalloprotease [Terriglobales bacterium]|nr:matrixin family metalloprotease [Terriglobales bacterium]
MSRHGLRRGYLLAAVALVLAIALPAWPYLLEFTRPAGGGTPQQPDHWDFGAGGFTVEWNLNPGSAGSNVVGSRTVDQVIQASFNAWTSAPNTSLPIGRGANSTKTAPAFDGVNVIAFTCSSSCDFTQEAETLAVAFTVVSDQVGEATMHGTTTSQFVGQILDSDIFFNPSVCYTTGSGGTCPTPSQTPQDMQTVAMHEIGHFLGIDHSGVVRAVMFPFAPDVQQTLSYDDVAAVSTLYPKSPPDFNSGSIAGTVRLNGAAVFGAHVFAESTTPAQPLPANIRKSPVSTLTFPDGTYRITGLPPDSYTVTAEPLDLPVINADVNGYPQAFGRSTVQTNFTTRWH